MQKILFVLGDEENVDKETAYRRLCQIVNEDSYDVTVLIGLNDVLEHIEPIKRIYYEEYSKEIKLNVLILKNLDNVDYVLNRFKFKIKEFPKSEIVINYTNGSNKLTATAMILAKMYGLKLQDKLKIEDTREFTTFNVVEKETSTSSALYFVKKLFNNYDYKMAEEIMDESYSSKDLLKKMFTKLIIIYSKWDSFIYENYDFDELLSFFTNLEYLSKNRDSMEILSDKNHELYNSYKIADLINNSHRRIKEKKYEDAIIRLYRTLELISEARLMKEYGINKSDVHMDEIEKLGIEEYALKKINQRLDFKYPKYNMPLTTSFFLLQKLYDDVGKHYYYNKDKYQNLFQKRNISVLVHGNYKYTTKELMQMYDLVYEMALVYDEKMPEYIDNTTFPTFKI